MFFKTQYNIDLVANSDSSAAPHDPVSLTVQSQAEETDLNVIMRRFGITGKLPEVSRIPSYGDYTHITDFRSALDMVRATQDAFNEFPAEIRARFDNDPQNLLLFAADPANRPMMKEMFGDKVSQGIAGSVGAAAAGNAPPAAGGAGADGGPASGGAAAAK